MTTRVPLATGIQARDAASIGVKDACIVNGYIDSRPDGRWVLTRPALTTQQEYTGGTFGGVGCGYIYVGTASPQKNHFWCVGGTFYRRPTSLYGTGGWISMTGSVTQTAQPFSFSEISPSYLSVFTHNDSYGYSLEVVPGAIVQVTDVNFPPNQTPALSLVHGTVYLDETIYVMTTTGVIYGSNLNDPTTWDPLNTISMSSDADGGIAIAKHLNYLVAFGRKSIEFFYDAGNPSGSSPLSVDQTLKMEIGCSFPLTISQVGAAQTLIWVGKGREGGQAVYMLEGTAPIKISNSVIERALDSFPTYGNDTNIYGLFGFSFVWNGKIFYVVGPVNSSTYGNMYLAYDITEKEWYVWSFASGTGQPSICCEEFTLSDYTTAPAIFSALGSSPCFAFYLDDSSINELGYEVISFSQTDNIDGGTKKYKFLSSLEIVGDELPTGTTFASPTIQYSDDDFQTWSTARNSDLTVDRSILFQFGRFSKRAFRVGFNGGRFRLKELELNITPGTV